MLHLVWIAIVIFLYNLFTSQMSIFYSSLFHKLIIFKDMCQNVAFSRIAIVIFLYNLFTSQIAIFSSSLFHKLILFKDICQNVAFGRIAIEIFFM